MPLPNSDNDILIPLIDNAAGPVTVSWSQNLSSKSAQYYVVIAKNISGEFPLFIAAEWYKSDSTGNSRHISKIGQTSNEGYTFKLDNNFHYGQTNNAGEQRFVVHHDKDRKPYQHRFTETATGSAGSSAANRLAQAFGVRCVSELSSFAKQFIGDYLRTF